MTGCSHQKRKHWAEKRRVGGAHVSLRKIVYCWALRLIGCEKFDRSRGFLGRFCVWGGGGGSGGDWLMLQEKIIEAHSECVLTQDVLECHGKYSTDTFKTHYFSHNLAKAASKRNISFHLGYSVVTPMGLSEKKI